MILAIENNGQFASFCEVAGHPEWASDKRFATNAQRVAHRSALIVLMRQTTILRRITEWIAALKQASVPCRPSNSIDQVFVDPPLRSRGMRIEIAHQQAWLGEHTVQVLTEWRDMAAEQLSALQVKWIIHCAE